MCKHAVVWFEHQEARVLPISESPDEAASILQPTGRRTEATTALGAQEGPGDSCAYFNEVARALQGVEEIHIMGASTAKLEFLRYVHRFVRTLEPRIVGIETIEPRTDGQLVQYAKRYFSH